MAQREVKLPAEGKVGHRWDTGAPICSPAEHQRIVQAYVDQEAARAPIVPPTAPPRRAPWQPSPTDPTELTISARALAKARGTVEDFARSYMPLLGLPVTDVLCFADSLYVVAASLYELDELNEQELDPSQAPAATALRTFLAGRGLLEDVQGTLNKGDVYWSLERQLGADWKRPPGVDDEEHEDNLPQQACRASASKSFDYHVLALLIAGLTGRKIDKQMMLFLGACFQLVEVEDDLKDYRKDHETGAFNIYAAFVRRYGADAPNHLRDWIGEREAYYLEARRAADLPDKLIRFHVERNEAQGGRGAGDGSRDRAVAYTGPDPTTFVVVNSNHRMLSQAI